MTETNDEQFPLPAVRKYRRGRFSAVWIVPIFAIVAAGALAVRTYLQTGPTIHITFESADGIEAGTSEVRYKNVPVGKVTDVDITSDHQRIIATVQLTPSGAAVAVGDSQFWVVRPRVGVGGVSGLGTLISGAFIEVDVGKSTEKVDTFVGLEKPPGVTHDQKGTRFKLTASDAGSLAAQSPVYLRRHAVGTITSLELAPGGKSVEIEIFVYAPYDRDVTENAVFWNASGLDVTIDATGLRVNTQSLATVVAGGIAFGFRDPNVNAKPAAEHAVFPLFEDRSHAFASPDSGGYPLAMRFHQPIRGLGNGVGVNIEFEGVHLGDVVAVRPGYDSQTHAFFFDVDANVFPKRLGAAYTGLVEEGARTGKTGPEMLQALVTRGLRAQLRSGNLLTGSFYVALDWFPSERGKPAGPEQPGVWVVPTVRGGTEQIQDQVASILAKIDRIPFDAIGGDVQHATRAAATLLGRLDQDVLPRTQALFANADLAMGALREGLTALRDNLAAPDSAIQQSTRTTLEQVERAAFSLRGLADYLQHHPESLLRGRAPGAQPKPSK
jgi:paraquat-inducible protein B